MPTITLKPSTSSSTLTGSIEAAARHGQAGYRVAIATNQSVIARGYYDIDTLNEMHVNVHPFLLQ